MSAVVAIIWAVALLVAAFLVLVFVGNLMLVDMFPEGRRWWMWPVRFGALAMFAAVVLANPFNGFLS